MGRSALPVDVHLALGNPNNLTKAVLAARAAAEIKISDKTLVEPAYVAFNTAAHGKWCELVALYEDLDFVTAADSGIVAEYCMQYAQYVELLSHLAAIQRVSFSDDEMDVACAAIEDVKGERAAAKMWRKIEYVLSIEAIMKMNAAINAKLVGINALQDRLFINPLSRIRTIPKKPQTASTDPAADAGFEDV